MQDLVAAIEHGHGRRPPTSAPPSSSRWPNCCAAAPRARGCTPLTDRERDVLRCRPRPHRRKEIASTFDISARTVETHRANLMRKLGVKSVALLTQVAIREGLVDPAP